MASFVASLAVCFSSDSNYTLCSGHALHQPSFLVSLIKRNKCCLLNTIEVTIMDGENGTPFHTFVSSPSLSCHISYDVDHWSFTAPSLTQVWEPRRFRWLMLGSCGVVFTAALLYTAYAVASWRRAAAGNEEGNDEQEAQDVTSSI